MTKISASTTKYKRSRMSDQTRCRIYTFINEMINMVRHGDEKLRKEFHITEQEMKELWSSFDLITPLQKNLGDSLNPILQYAEQFSAGQISVRKVQGKGGLFVTVHTYGPSI